MTSPTSTTSTMSLLGIDAGGTVVKAVLFDDAGHELSTGSAARPRSMPRAGWVECDMDAAWDATVEAIRECLAAAGNPVVDAVGIVGHNDGAYLVDDALRPVRPAILASDNRAEDVLDRWRTSGVLDASLPLIGQQPFAASPVTLLRWLADHEPDALTRTRWFLFCKDWLRLQLTGEIATDASEASASFTSVDSALSGQASYDDQILELFDLPSLSKALPPIQPSHAVAGSVTTRAAAATGLRQGTPVVTGAHDVDAAAIGVGAVDAGAMSVVAGTFSINQIISADLHLDGRWQARAFVQPGRLLNMSTSPASASTLDWFVRRLCPTDDFGFIDPEVVAAQADPSTLVFLPYLYGTPLAPHAEGGFIGLSGWHTRGHLLRALMEGVVCNHRLHIEALSSAFRLPASVRCTGGGMQSMAWRQMFADGLRMRVEVPDTSESGARGAAVLAGQGIGAYADLAEAVRRTVRIAAVHEPERPDDFDAVYRRFTTTMDALRPLWLRQD